MTVSIPTSEHAIDIAADWPPAGDDVMLIDEVVTALEVTVKQIRRLEHRGVCSIPWLPKLDRHPERVLVERFAAAGSRSLAGNEKAGRGTTVSILGKLKDQGTTQVSSLRSRCVSRPSARTDERLHGCLERQGRSMAEAARRARVGQAGRPHLGRDGYGRPEVALRLDLKAIEKLIGAIKSHLRVKEMEAWNQS